MTRNEQVIRALYAAAEVQDSKKFASLFTDDGVFNDVSADVKYHGKELGRVVDIYAAAFPDMHRELYDVYEIGEVIVVETWRRTFAPQATGIGFDCGHFLNEEKPTEVTKALAVHLHQ
jgi:hypothetical protein